MSNNIRQFIPWNSDNTEAVLAQLTAHVRAHKEAGRDSAIVACLITMVPDGEGGAHQYEATYSALPQEMVVFAAEIIKRAVI